MGKIHNNRVRKDVQSLADEHFPVSLLVLIHTAAGLMEQPSAAPEDAYGPCWAPRLMGKAFCLLPCPKTHSKLMNLVQNHQCVCNGQAAMLWLYSGRLPRQFSTSTGGRTSSFSSGWGGNTFGTSLTNTETEVWSQMHPQRDHPSTLQMWITWGDWKLVSKSNLNRKVKSVWREKGWKMPARTGWHFPGSSVVNSVSVSVLSCLY